MMTYNSYNNGTSCSGTNNNYNTSWDEERLLRTSTPGPTSNPFNFTSPFLQSPTSSVSSSSSPPTGQFGGIGGSSSMMWNGNNNNNSPIRQKMNVVGPVGSPVRRRGSNSFGYHQDYNYPSIQPYSSLPISTINESVMDRIMMLRWVSWLTNMEKNKSPECVVQRMHSDMIVALKNYLLQLLLDDHPQQPQQQQQWPRMSHWDTSNIGSTMLENPSSFDIFSNNNNHNSIPPSPRSNAGSDHNNGPDLVQLTWNGNLPPRQAENPIYSVKVFLGGLPHDVDQQRLHEVFQKNGKVTINWPGREDKGLSSKRHAYLLFSDNEKVRKLLQNCTMEFDRGNEVSWFYNISSDCKVEVIPWIVTDNSYPTNGVYSSSSLVSATSRLEYKKTIFVGGLYGKINAHGLFSIMEDLFGPVTHVGIDTDRYRYPIGSARVTFQDRDSYMKAVEASFVEIATATFTKRIQIEPYIVEAKCSQCGAPKGPFFCREVCCFRYFCDSCNKGCHSSEEFRDHRRISRNFRRIRGGRP